MLKRIKPSITEQAITTFRAHLAAEITESLKDVPRVWITETAKSQRNSISPARLLKITRGETDPTVLEVFQLCVIADVAPLLVIGRSISKAFFTDPTTSERS